MFIDGLINADALPVLRTTMRFAARRHELIAANVANLDTPNYRPRDVSVEGFRKALAQAVDDRRERWGGARGELRLGETRELRSDGAGNLRLVPRESGRNILFHDRNNRDVERTMQDLVENTATFRVAADLLRSRMDLLNAAIRERI